MCKKCPNIERKKNGLSSQDVTCVFVCQWLLRSSRGDRSDTSASKTDHTPLPTLKTNKKEDKKEGKTKSCKKITLLHPKLTTSVCHLLIFLKKKNIV